MHERLNLLQLWLNANLKNTPFKVKPITGDASFRRYFRIVTPEQSFIVMDAPPEKESIQTFISLAITLQQHGIRVPKIYEKNVTQGFLLLEDFGDQLLLETLDHDNADLLYKAALDTLAHLQTCQSPAVSLSCFNEQMIHEELDLFIDWFLNRFLQISLSPQDLKVIKKTFTRISNEIVTQRYVFTHKDYHSRNLLVIEDKISSHLGIIDFQDAIMGPITYDLVSLLKDCYIQWPREKVVTWVKYFYDAWLHTSKQSFQNFLHEFDLCGLQRHLKVLGIFCRLHLRDGKSNYLQDLSSVFDYVLEFLKTHEDYQAFYSFICEKVQPIFNEKMAL